MPESNDRDTWLDQPDEDYQPKPSRARTWTLYGCLAWIAVFGIIAIVLGLAGCQATPSANATSRETAVQTPDRTGKTWFGPFTKDSP